MTDEREDGLRTAVERALYEHWRGAGPPYDEADNETREEAEQAADAAIAAFSEWLASGGMRPITVYRCPKCGGFSERDIHCYVKGPPLFPQMDDYTICERVEGFFIEAAALQAALPVQEGAEDA